MNVRVVFLFGFSALSVVSSSLEGMYFDALHTIERALVIREIKIRGIDAVRREVYNAQDSKPVNRGMYCGFTEPTVLFIDGIFEQKNAATDLLTSDIFKEIQERELKRGYSPKPIKKVMSSCASVTAATNYIGSATHYYWLEENGKQLPAVKIEARLSQ